MTVRELIEELEKIENKDLDVIINSYDYGDVVAEYVFDNATRYFGKANGMCWTTMDRKCVVIN